MVFLFTTLAKHEKKLPKPNKCVIIKNECSPAKAFLTSRNVMKHHAMSHTSTRKKNIKLTFSNQIRRDYGIL